MTGPPESPGQSDGEPTTGSAHQAPAGRADNVCGRGCPLLANKRSPALSREGYWALADCSGAGLAAAASASAAASTVA